MGPGLLPVWRSLPPSLLQQSHQTAHLHLGEVHAEFLCQVYWGVPNIVLMLEVQPSHAPILFGNVC